MPAVRAARLARCRADHAKLRADPLPLASAPPTLRMQHDHHAGAAAVGPAPGAALWRRAQRSSATATLSPRSCHTHTCTQTVCLQPMQGMGTIQIVLSSLVITNAVAVFTSDPGSQLELHVWLQGASRACVGQPSHCARLAVYAGEPEGLGHSLRHTLGGKGARPPHPRLRIHPVQTINQTINTQTLRGRRRTCRASWRRAPWRAASPCGASRRRSRRVQRGEAGPCWGGIRWPVVPISASAPCPACAQTLCWSWAGLL